jgi:hypothetical protein
MEELFKLFSYLFKDSLILMSEYCIESFFPALRSKFISLLSSYTLRVAEFEQKLGMSVPDDVLGSVL